MTAIASGRIGIGSIPRAENLEAIAGVVAKQAFGHLAKSGVAAAENQGSFFGHIKGCPAGIVRVAARTRRQRRGQPPRTGLYGFIARINAASNLPDMSAYLATRREAWLLETESEAAAIFLEI
jgi:hypothetical protein